MTDPRLDLAIDGPIARLTIRRADKLNALDAAMADALLPLCRQVERSAARVLILTGEGERSFSAGGDIEAWSSLSPEAFGWHWLRDGHQAFGALARLTIPVVAVLNGHCLGGGLELAACCDIRVMTPRASLALPEAGVGIVPGWSGTQRVARLLPEPALKEMALFGRRIGAERALALGFAAEIAEDTLAAARAIAARAVTLSPRAAEVTKYMIHAGAGEAAEALIEALGSGMIAASADRAEGVAAFADKRPPAFPGR